MRIIWGPQTILCPEMFSINFWHQRKKGMLCFFPHVGIEKSQLGLLVQGLEHH